MAIEFPETKANESPLKDLLSNSGSKKCRFPASALIQLISSLSSSSIYLYDLASQIGLGDLLKEIEKSGNGAPVIDMETRSGAGLALVGRISGQTSAVDENGSRVITAYTTPDGLAHMATSLALTQKPSEGSNRLVIQVPNVTIRPDTLDLTPSLASLSSILPLLPEHIAIVVSSNSQEAVDTAKMCYEVSDKHIIHIFDQYAATREDRQVTLPDLGSSSTAVPFHKALISLGHDYFDYTGPSSPETAIVMVNGPLTEYAKSLVSGDSAAVGVVSVRVIKPWNEEAFLKVVPSSVKKIIIVDEMPEDSFSPGYLYGEVFQYLFDPNGFDIILESKKICPAQMKAHLDNPSSIVQWLQTFSADLGAREAAHGKSKKLLFWSAPSTTLSALPTLVSDTFATSHTVHARHQTEFDLFSKPGGVALDRVVLSSASTKSNNAADVGLRFVLPTEQSAADFIAIADQNLLKSHNILGSARDHTPVLVLSTWTVDELHSNLSSDVVELIRNKDLRVYLFNCKEVAKDINETKKEIIEPMAAYMAFMRLYLGEGASRRLVETLTEVAFKGSSSAGALANLSGTVWEKLQEVDFSDVDITAKRETEKEGSTSALQRFEFNSIVRPKIGEFDDAANKTSVGSWMDAAKYLLFREAYSLPSSETTSATTLRPDLLEERFLVTCTVNRRLTPLEYERNVFHLEFDTSNTGLKYEIGEALGVHGWNDADDVMDFCNWYGIDSKGVITLPVPESGGEKMHTRTVFQVLQQQIDIFGRPSKSFYGALAEHATSREDRMSLLFIAAPEGASTFKKLAEVDTVTFADVLERFKSARPGVEILAELVGDIKPRHYSIASAMSAVGDRVDLLVVTVDWVTPSGSPRYGQCTRYLADMKVGQKVTVSIKPSVMKLPPDDMQPIIMAGLGTGAAPFRAFMQHRALLQSKKIPTGPLLYYFGSRHRSEEYLYGEEIEAYLASAVLTHAGLAFSRDQKRKVYIQHKMRDDAESLVKMLKRDEGVFYLCGPTWPVPDVYEALVGALVQYEGTNVEEAGNYLEGLKEEERYVLEVY